jgi:hypothetical protein
VGCGWERAGAGEGYDSTFVDKTVAVAVLGTPSLPPLPCRHHPSVEVLPAGEGGTSFTLRYLPQGKPRDLAAEGDMLRIQQELLDLLASEEYRYGFAMCPRLRFSRCS